MARGMLGGILFGGAVSVGAAVAIAVLLDPPTRPDAVVAAPARSNAPTAPDRDAAAGYGDADLVTGGGVPTVPAPRPETTAEVTAAGTDTPLIPSAGDADVPGFDNGTSGSETALAALPQSEVVLPAPQAALPDAPDAPGASEELSISTEPAQPPAPKVEDPLDTFNAENVETPLAPGVPEVGGEPVIAAPRDAGEDPAQTTVEGLEGPVADAAPVADAPAAPIAEAANSAASAEPETGTADIETAETVTAGAETAATEVGDIAPAEAETAAVDTGDAETGDAETGDAETGNAETGAAESVEAGTPVPSQTAETEAPQTETEETTTANTETAATPEAETPEAETPKAETPDAETQTPSTDSSAAAPALAQAPQADDTAGDAVGDGARIQIGRPARSIINRSAEGAQTSAAAAPAQTDATPSGPALEAFAEGVENPEGKPLMSIVLIDDADQPAEGDASLSALKRFPFPLSFAVDPTLPDAAERMAAYRAAGFEVLALIDFPSGATPQDAAVNLDATLALLPRTVALIEGPTTGLQERSDVGDLVLSTIKESGHGLVLQSRGLNALQRDADRAGVPSRIVFRDVDSAGQDARTIRRFLDQAAFRAGQEGGVVMMGRLRAETVTALLSWGGQDRAQRVTLAPVSSVLSQ